MQSHLNLTHRLSDGDCVLAFDFYLNGVVNICVVLSEPYPVSVSIEWTKFDLSKQPRGGIRVKATKFPNALSMKGGRSPDALCHLDCTHSDSTSNRLSIPTSWLRLFPHCMVILLERNRLLSPLWTPSAETRQKEEAKDLLLQRSLEEGFLCTLLLATDGAWLSPDPPQSQSIEIEPNRSIQWMRENEFVRETPLCSASCSVGL